jgi:hypothetical protein
MIAIGRSGEGFTDIPESDNVRIVLPGQGVIMIYDNGDHISVRMVGGHAMLIEPWVSNEIHLTVRSSNDK